MNSALEQDASATLIWLQEGLVPDSAWLLARPTDVGRGPEDWPHFADAFRYAMNVPRLGEWLPWIQVGDRTISPEELRRMYVPRSHEFR
ncbi:hypothetical protein MOX02_60130 [Methylobacterium oxalidis]|uniref:Uncharacterized protein n=1 Tax=Methylobacterium oxalidis TaxID=944322 RepID=A0A512JDG8_9HYPH|nr:hypothetical protein MOX02_60130 [Methylobacterium oxalidis]GLS64513.1 hypothetical protein GCM10007888_28940 [Methylobacterium oxalidis]